MAFIFIAFQWKALMDIGREQSDDLLNSTLAKIAINECCTLVYTVSYVNYFIYYALFTIRVLQSGTVGNPKGVMLHHDNLCWDALSVCERLQVERGCEKIISYLPLSHVAAQVVDIYIAITIAGTVYFADKDALKGSLINTLQEVQPTYFLGVPRVWEKIYEKMMQIGAQGGSLKKSIATWAKGHGLQHNLDKMNG